MPSFFTLPPDLTYGTNLASGARTPPGTPAPGTSPPTAPSNPNTPGNPAVPNKPGSPGPILAFIEQYQQTHPPSEGIGPLVAALKAAGYDVSQFMYGATPSNNELVINGQKWKVLGGEDNPGSAYWYKPGMDDSGPGARGASNNPWANGGLLNPVGEPFTMNDVINDPGFAARQEAFGKSLDRSATANGTFNTGGFKIDAATELANNASAEFANAFGRGLSMRGFNNDLLTTQQRDAYNKLYQTAGLGLGGAETVVGSNNNASGIVGGTQIGQGNVAAGSAIARGTPTPIDLSGLSLPPARPGPAPQTPTGPGTAPPQGGFFGPPRPLEPPPPRF